MQSGRRSGTARRDYDVTAVIFLIILAFTCVPTNAQGSKSSVLATAVTTILVYNESSTERSSTVHLTTVQGASTSVSTAQSLGSTAAPDATDAITEEAQEPLAPSTEQTTENIATDDFSLTSGNNTYVTVNGTGGGSGHDKKEKELEIEFFVIIISTVLVIIALVIVLAALVFWCCKRRSQRPSPFVKFKKTNAKYDKMDLELGNTLPRNDSGGREWIFSTGDAVDDHESIDLNLRSTQLINGNYDPEDNGNIEIAPSISDYHSESNHGVVATLELEDDDNNLNVNPMYSVDMSASRGSIKDSGINGSGSDDQYDADMSIRSDLQSFADETVEL